MKDKLNRFFSVYIFCVEYKMLNSAESRSLLGSLSILCGLNICKKKKQYKDASFGSSEEKNKRKDNIAADLLFALSYQTDELSILLFHGS